MLCIHPAFCFFSLFACHFSSGLSKAFTSVATLLFSQTNKINENFLVAQGTLFSEQHDWFATGEGSFKVSAKR